MIIQQSSLLPLCLLFLGCIPGSLQAADELLFDFSDEESLAKFRPLDAKLALAPGGKLRVDAAAKCDWPSANYEVPDGIDLSGHGRMVVPLRNLDSEPLRVFCRIDSLPPGAAKGTEMLKETFDLEIAGGATAEMEIPLVPHPGTTELKPEVFFGMRGVPFFKKSPMHLKNIVGITFFVTRSDHVRTFEIGSVRSVGEAVPVVPIPDNPFPLIDEFGQFKHADWPGKTSSAADLVAARERETAVLAKLSPPSSWSRFGGWKDGPQFESTGGFRTTKHEGKWHLVDPDGRLFFSLGIDCVGFGNETYIEERENWFEKLPAQDVASSEFYRDWFGEIAGYHYHGKKALAFNFHKHNVMRKYGEGWRQKFAATTAERLPKWGINTMGSWSEFPMTSLKKVPYTAFISFRSPPIEGSTGYWGKFADVFHPEFKKSLIKRFERKDILAAKDDPWCIGYFVDNELGWGDETSLALATLASPDIQHAKHVFLADLKAKYDSIEALNKVWKTKHVSWDALLFSTEPPAVEPARVDLEAFYAKIAQTYFGTIRKQLKEFAPDRLYLGCRFHGTNRIATAAAAKHCDVVSFNAYTRKIADKFPQFAEAGDKPVIIGEFHFGALDRGMFHPGLIPVANQAERAVAFTEYVTDCLAAPNIVGCHWFQYVDSPTTGRSWDGENYQIGFTDNCDTPYREMIEASRKVGGQLYKK